MAETFELATERRAKEWQEYERTVSEKEALRARMEAEQRREEEQRLKEEIAMLRQEQVSDEAPPPLADEWGFPALNVLLLYCCRGNKLVSTSAAQRGL